MAPLPLRRERSTCSGEVALRPPPSAPFGARERGGPHQLGGPRRRTDRVECCPEGEQRGRVRRACGEGGGIHGVRGALGGVLARGPGLSPDICPRARPSPPVFTLRKHST